MTEKRHIMCHNASEISIISKSVSPPWVISFLTKVINILDCTMVLIHILRDLKLKDLALTVRQECAPCKLPNSVIQWQGTPTLDSSQWVVVVEQEGVPDRSIDMMTRGI